MKHLTTALIAAAALWTASPAPASAMPVSNLGDISREASSNVEKVVWVCGPFRCWWRPAFYAPIYVGPRPWGWGCGGWGCGGYGAVGWYRPWRPWGWGGGGWGYRRGWW